MFSSQLVNFTLSIGIYSHYSLIVFLFYLSGPGPAVKIKTPLSTLFVENSPED